MGEAKILQMLHGIPRDKVKSECWVLGFFIVSTQPLLVWPPPSPQHQ